MRTLYVTEFISLDGVVEAPGGEGNYKHTGWTFDIAEDPTMYDFKGEELFGTETLLVGRTTYETFSGAWPEREGDLADKMNTMDKVVVSTTLIDPTWKNTTVMRDLDAVRALKEGEGGPIQVAGSTTLAQALHKAGLVDTWNLMVFPVVLGSGKRLFPTDAEDKQKPASASPAATPMVCSSTSSTPCGDRRPCRGSGRHQLRRRPRPSTARGSRAAPARCPAFGRGRSYAETRAIPASAGTAARTAPPWEITSVASPGWVSAISWSSGERLRWSSANRPRCAR